MDGLVKFNKKRKITRWAVLLGLLFAGVFLLASTVQAVQIKRIQKGDIYLDVDDMSATASILPVDQSKTLILIYPNTGVNNIDLIYNNLYTVLFESDSSIVISRDFATSVDVTITYYVIEFTDGVNVQRGISSFIYGVYQNPDYRIKDVALPVSVDPAKSFAVVNCRSYLASSTVDEQTLVTGTVIGANTLRLERNSSYDSNRVLNMVWQVVEFQTDAEVRSGETWLDVNSLTNTTAISPPIPAGKLNQTMLLYSVRGNQTINGIEGYYRVNGTIKDEGNVTFSRGYASATANTAAQVHWDAIYLNDSSSYVQYNRTTMASGTAFSKLDAPSSFDADRSMFTVGVGGVASSATTWEDQSQVVPGGEIFKGVVHDPSTKTVWTTGYSTGMVYKFNATTGAYIGNYTVGTRPIAICYDPANQDIWVANYDSNNVTRLNAANGAFVAAYTVGTQPIDIVYDNTTNSVWTVNYGVANVSRINTTTGVIAGFASRATQATSICYDPVLARMWLAYWANDRISYFTCAAGARTDVDVGATNQFYSRVRYGLTSTTSLGYNTVWYASLRYNYLLRVRADATATRVTYYPDLAPQGLTWDNSTKSMWIANYASNKINKMNSTNGVVEGTYGTLSNPYDIVFDDTNTKVWVAASNARSLQKFNPVTGAVEGNYSLPYESAIYLARNNNNLTISTDWQIAEFAPLTIKTPNGGQLWRIGEARQINWTYADSNAEDSASIRLSMADSASLSSYTLPVNTTAVKVNDNTTTDGTNIAYYNWSIPRSISSTNIIGKTLRLAVVDNDLSVRNFDVSSAPFTILPVISITDPAPNTIWTIGSSTNYINWTKNGDMVPTLGNFTIKMSDAGGSYSIVLADNINQSAANCGSDDSCSYNWNAWNSTMNASAYNRTMQVSWAYDPTNVVATSGNFSVKVGLALTYPNGNEILNSMSNTSINWTRSGSWPGDLVNITYSLAGGPDQVIANNANSNCNSCNYTWYVNESAISDYVKVKVTSVDVDTLKVSDDSNATFKILPYIHVDYPNTNATVWFVGTEYPINWTLTGSMNKVHIWYSKYVDGNWTLWNQSRITPADGVSASSGGYPWNVTPGAVSAYQGFKVRVAQYMGDAVTVGSPYDDSDQAFTVKGTVNVQRPGDNIENFKVGANELINWTVAGLTNADLVKIKFARYGDFNSSSVLTSAENATNGTWLWSNIPDSTTVTNTAKIRVELASDSSVGGESISGFYIKPILYLITPNGGETVYIGGNLTINWTSSGTVGNVYLNYTTDDNNYTYSVEGRTFAPGESPYNWTVPAGAGLGSQVKFKVMKVGEESIFDTSNETLIIRGILNITQPDGDEVWEVNTTKLIKWNRLGTAMGNIQLRYTTDNGTTDDYTHLIGNYSSGAGASGVEWDVPNVMAANPGQVYNQIRLKILSLDDPAGTYDTSNKTFSIIPRFFVTAPLQDETYAVNDTLRIKWMTYGNVSTINLDYSNDTGLSWVSIKASQANGGSGSETTYDWPVADIIGNLTQVRVISSLDSRANDSSPTFKVKGNVSFDYPLGGETVNVDAPFTIRWKPYGSIGNVTIKYSYNEGATFPINVNSTGDPINASDRAFAWAVPDHIDTNKSKFNITSEKYPDVFKVSEAFSIKGAINVTSPSSGNTFYIGGAACPIQWTPHGSIGQVSIYYDADRSSMGTPAPVEVGKEYDVNIEDIAREGDGIARVEGFVIFVADTKVGDAVKIQIDKVMRRFAIGHKV
ncbi:MAG: TRAM domain-containing protein [bacterium]